jgi:NAD(P)-dependent dehydrogenase (short-subunit alcohol dehydrogenase family)
VELTGVGAVVTGGASGIGAAVGQALREAGARVSVWDRVGGDGRIRCDVTEEADVDAAMEETLAATGLPSIMVTCAGIGAFQPVHAIQRDTWERVLAVNLTGTMLCLRAAAREMWDTGGSIVCVSSINASIADRGMAAYCCSKAAVDMLARVAAAELGARGIRVNAVAPGVTDTPLLTGAVSVPGFASGVVSRTPLGGLGSPQQIAQAVTALLRADWVTGQSLVVDGGLALHSPVDIYGIVNSEA